MDGKHSKLLKIDQNWRIYPKNHYNRVFFKKSPYSEKIVVWMKKQFFTKWSKNRWIWHFYNAFRSAKPIQIQPINPNSIKIRKNRKKSGFGFNFRVIFLLIILRLYVLGRLTYSNTPKIVKIGVYTPISTILRCFPSTSYFFRIETFLLIYIYIPIYIYPLGYSLAHLGLFYMTNR